jgi:hypothetical protein
MTTHKQPHVVGFTIIAPRQQPLCDWNNSHHHLLQRKITVHAAPSPVGSGNGFPNSKKQTISQHRCRHGFRVSHLSAAPTGLFRASPCVPAKPHYLLFRSPIREPRIGPEVPMQWRSARFVTILDQSSRKCPLKMQTNSVLSARSTSFPAWPLLRSLISTKMSLSSVVKGTCFAAGDCHWGRHPKRQDGYHSMAWHNPGNSAQ